MKASFSLLFMILINLVVFKIAIAETCLVEKEPTDYKIKQFEAEIDIDRSKSISEIEQLAGDSVHKRFYVQKEAYNKELQFETDGLTRYKLEIQMSYIVESQPLKSGQYCMYVSVLKVGFGVKKYSVFLSNQAAVGSCRYRVIHDHEFQHVGFAKETISSYLPQLKDWFSFLDDWSVKHGQDRETETKELRREMNEKALAFVTKVKKAISEKDSKIDSIEAYIEQSRICQNTEHVVRSEEQTEEPQMP